MIYMKFNWLLIVIFTVTGRKSWLTENELNG